MTPVYAFKLSLEVWTTKVGVQKIDGSLLTTFGMVIAGFQIEDKLGKARFFQKLFLLVDTNMEVILEIFFLIFSNADIQFLK